MGKRLQKINWQSYNRELINWGSIIFSVDEATLTDWLHCSEGPGATGDILSSVLIDNSFKDNEVFEDLIDGANTDLYHVSADVQTMRLESLLLSMPRWSIC